MRNQLKNQRTIKYKELTGIIDDVQISDYINYGTPNLENAIQLATTLWLMYNDNGITVEWDSSTYEFTINGALNQTETIELFEFLIDPDYLYVLSTEYVSGTTDGYMEFISGKENGVTRSFNGDDAFILEYIDYVLFRFNDDDRYTFDNFKFKIILNTALYTGEKIDKYGSTKEICVVVSFLKGKIYNEQMGIIYEYAATLQHMGESIIKEGSLIWLRNATTEDADYIVKGIVPSLNSVIYHLIKKEV